MINRILTYNGKVLDLNNNKTATSNIAVIDVDGNYYNSVIIGNQEWLIQNLKTTKYADGSPITNLESSTAWAIDTSGAYCWYDNSIGYKETYGALYNWYVVNNSSSRLAPDGWKIASKADYHVLKDYLGGVNTFSPNTWLYAGGKLKEVSTYHWTYPNAGATDEYEFKAVANGYRNSEGEFGDMNNYATSWTSTLYNVGSYILILYYSSDSLTLMLDLSYKWGYSVRCMRYVNFPEVSIGTQIWAKFNYDVGGSVYPNDSIANVDDYGSLYTWEEAQTINVPGWHVPTLTEFDILQNYVGVSNGGMLKEVSTYHWNAPNTGATDDYGFSALGAGSGGSSFKIRTGFWSSTETTSETAYYMNLSCDSSLLAVRNTTKTVQFSVRLIKNS